MANIFESAFMTLKNGMTMYFADSKARQWLQKLQEALAKKYGPDNPPPSTAGKIWYATCSTASGTGAKTATSSTGDFVLATGAMVRVQFSNSNTAANPTISIDGSTAKAIRPISSASGMDYMWRAGEVIDIVYDGSNFVASDCGKASTSFYGVTKLDSSTSSTAEDVAATPKAVKDVADAKVAKAGDTMTGSLYIEQASGDTFLYAKRTDTSVRARMGVGSGGQNHGVYSDGYNDGVWHSSGLWMLYRDNAGGVIVNGKATNNVLKSGDTMTGNLFVTKAGNAYVQAENSVTGVKLNLDTGGSTNHGIYSYGYYDGSSFHSSTAWMIYRNSVGAVIVNGHSIDDFNLQQGTSIPNNSDLDNYTTPGCYYVLSSTEAATMTNGPIKTGGYKLVVMVGSIANRRHQLAFVQGSNTQYRRYYDGSAWGPWELALLSTDRGSSGNWRWVKRNDGTCDLYYQEAAHTVDCSTAKGSIYVQSAQQTLAYPFTVYRGVASVDFYVNSNAYMTWATQIAVFESKLYYRIASCSSGSSLSGTFAVHVAGYWQSPG